MPTDAYAERIASDRAAIARCFRCFADRPAAPSDIAQALRSGLLSKMERATLIVLFLLTPAQRSMLDRANINLDMVWKYQGRFSDHAMIEAIYDEWNKYLGVICFRSPHGKHGDPYPTDRMRNMTRTTERKPR